VLAVLIGLYLLGNSLRVKILGFLKGLLDGLLSIYHTPYKFRFIADSLLIWGLYLLMFFLPFHCMPETALMGTGAIMAAFVFGSFSVVLTPGGTGTYHFAVGLALSLYGLDLGIGQALGLAIWASQAFMLIVLGALSLLLVPRYNRNYEGHTAVPVQKTKTS
jgi:glycosyltransferase 2 family protein